MIFSGYTVILFFLLSFVGFVNGGVHLTFYIIEDNDKYLKPAGYWLAIALVMLILFITISKIFLT